MYLPASDEELESSGGLFGDLLRPVRGARSNLNDKIDTNYYNMLSYLYGSLPLATRLASGYSARTPAGGVTDTDYDKYELGGFQYYRGQLLRLQREPLRGAASRPAAA